MVRILATVIVALLLVAPAVGRKPPTPKLRSISTDWKAEVEADVLDSPASSATQILQRQVITPDVTVETEHESWFSKMFNSIIGAVFGIVLMIFSLPVLWLNEKRHAKYEALIARGEKECRSVGADDFESKNTHWLVHVTGDTSSTRPVKDTQFNVGYDSGVVKITSTVEIYQYVEEERKETKKKNDFIGGGTTTQTKKWKEYHAEWLSSYNSGASFDKPEFRNPPLPKGLENGVRSKSCTRVELGKGFLLDNAEIDRLYAGENAHVDKLVCEANQELEFVAANDGWYHCGKGTATNPVVGDARVQFKVLKDGPVTVVGLQVEKENGRGGFLPYRDIQRPLCPFFSLSDEVEKERLYEEATKDKHQINDKEMWHGAMMCLCCACNAVQWIYGEAMTTDILDTFDGKLSKCQAFDRMKGWANTSKWVCRAVGWLMMFIGLCLFFSPITTFLEIMPFGIGTFLSSLGSFLVFVASFMVTLAVSSVIVALSYCMYHPVYGIMMIAGIGAATFGIVTLCHKVHGS